jgi:predicted phage terminase large subunit-like protein
VPRRRSRPAPERLTLHPTEAERQGRPWSVTYMRAVNPDGTLLWPGHMSMDELRALAQSGGRALLDATYMQDPSKLAGDVFSPEWFRYYVHAGYVDPWGLAADDLIAEGLAQIKLPAAAGLVTAQAVDLAVKQHDTADYYARVVGYRDAQGRLYIEDVYQDRLTPGGMVRDMVASGHRYRVDIAGIESDVFQSLVFQEAVRGNILPFKPLETMGRDKVMRARPLAILMEQNLSIAAGRVFIRYDMPTRAIFEAQLMNFPHGDHDDMVDAAAWFYECLREYDPVEAADVAELLDELRRPSVYDHLS